MIMVSVYLVLQEPHEPRLCGVLTGGAQASKVFCLLLLFEGFPACAGGIGGSKREA